MMASADDRAGARDIDPSTRQAEATEQAVVAAVETKAVLTRQRYLTFLILLLAAWVARGFLLPLAWAAVLAVAEWPLYRRALVRAPRHGGLLALGFTLATALLVILPISLAAVALAQESQAALGWLAQVQKTGLQEPAWLGALPLVGGRADAFWRDHIGNPQAANELLGTLSAGSLLGWTQSVGGQVAHGTLLFLITLVALSGLLARGAAIAEQAGQVARRMLGGFGEQFLDRLVAAMRATLNGTVLVSVGEGALVGVGYAIAGVPRPLLFAVLTIALAMVPFGAWLAFGAATLILLVQGNLLPAALLFGFSVVVMTVGDNVLQPRVIGSAVKLPFLLAIVGTFGGLESLGLVGLFVGPVVMVAMLLIWRQWMQAGRRL
ncbi:AI-2E family transporter [Sphingomonas bacterium]|uniref:AI-2E family transporter n=1 Tax=Sphingomonas bacterium TaxID=1895847 RepID=UPI0015773804|nr:AI-2E family transporter [Sphingomonas bacterium]